ncbi:MAG: DUF420 domain-containing protein [Planctomycetes bacterium]|nr:DUF420 domain-containing protein [Planctomycetota bacterium]MCB9869018.1 DUF420 domain-containing protein [Planctomycetota bacterium]MCB9887978.1 DUF420 domain-containing protein [Planctomycetota bacterium]
MLAQFDFRVLADVNATLNATALVLILTGLWAIKRNRLGLHKALMLAAALVSALFLVSYVVYHLNAEAVRFRGQGAIRPLYFTILISHVVLAAVQVPLILTTIVLGLRDRRAAHRRWAKITAPIWVYVSFTGVAVYYLLYHYAPS